MRFLLLLIVGSQIAAPLPELAKLRVGQPDLLIPGTSRMMLGAEPPGFVVCCAVERYFDDETPADLEEELNLAAKQQLYRFLSASTLKDHEAGGKALSFGEFRRHAVWWEGNALHGLYFVPSRGIEWVDTGERPAEPGDKEGLDAAGLLLKGRALRKAGRFTDARLVFDQLREQFPLTSEARRALHEIFLANTAARRSSPK